MCCEHNSCMLLTARVRSVALQVVSDYKVYHNSHGCGKCSVDAHAQNVKQEGDAESSGHFCECTSLSKYTEESCNFTVLPAKCLFFAPAVKVRKRS